MAKKRSRKQKVIEKAAAATTLAPIGAEIGAPAGPPGAIIGGAIGALAGLIIGDQPITLSIPYVAIPAFEYSRICSGNPSHSIYLHEGDQVTRPQPSEHQESLIASKGGGNDQSGPKKRARLNKWQRFVRDFKFRPRRKNESGRDYGAARLKAASKEYKRRNK